MGPPDLVPFILSIDIEPDDHYLEKGRKDDWRGFEAIVPKLQTLRERISRATGRPATFTWNWRMDPQVAETYGDPAWAAKRYGSSAEELERSGDNFGIHTHAYRWSSENDEWVVDLADQGWVEHCVRSGFDAWTDAFGRPPRIASMGNDWINGETISLLESLGIAQELSISPLLPAVELSNHLGAITGARLDLTRVPSVPYQPSDDDLRVAGPFRQDGIWLIPISTGRCPYGAGTPNGWRRRVPELLGRQSVPSRYLLRMGPGQFKRAFERRLRSGGKTHFNFPIRTSLALNEGAFRLFEGSIDYLLGHREAKRFVFCSPREALQHLGLV